MKMYVPVEKNTYVIYEGQPEEIYKYFQLSSKGRKAEASPKVINISKEEAEKIFKNFPFGLFGAETDK